jgi:non-ribosomal peptide synthetase component E (peptide arylation enzyme)
MKVSAGRRVPANTPDIVGERVGVTAPLPGVVYPDPERLRTYVAAGELPEQSLVGGLAASFATNAQRTALLTCDRAVTYAELDDLTNRAAYAFLQLGLRPLDRVLFQAANSLDVIFAFIGCLKAKLIPVCTLPAHREREISYLGAFSDAHLHIVDGDDPKFDLEAFALAMRASIPTMDHIVSLRGRPREGVSQFDTLIAGADPSRAAAVIGGIAHDPYQVVVFQLSGGSTGTPKVITRFGNDYLLNARLTIDILGYRPGDVVFNPMPMLHNACMICSWLPALLSGATFQIADDLTPAAWTKLFRVMKPTFIGLIRALLPRLDTAVAEFPDMLEDVRAFWCPDAARTVRERYGIRSHAMFGMTEGMNMYVRSDDPPEVQDWCVGTPMSRFDEVRLVAPGTDREVGNDEPGELQCRGPYTLRGYYNAPERNREAFTPDGFYKTGDLLVRREIAGKTHYAFAGRFKDIVNRGMEKISCEELEHAVSTHDAVLDVAIVGMADETLGERVCAYVVLRPAATAPTVAELGAFLHRYGLAKFKWPERIEVTDALPLTQAGKLDKNALRSHIDAKRKEELQGAER